MLATREDLAWVAGFYEGEGSIGYRISNNRPRVTIQVGQNDREPLERLQRAVGFGSINGPYKYRSQDNPYHHWSVHQFQAVQAFIAMIWEWLSERRRVQAASALHAFLEEYHRLDIKPRNVSRLVLHKV